MTGTLEKETRLFQEALTLKHAYRHSNHACPVPLKDVSPQVPVIPRVGKPILVRLHTQDAYDVQRKPQRHAWVFHPSAFAGGLIAY